MILKFFAVIGSLLAAPFDMLYNLIYIAKSISTRADVFRGLIHQFWGQCHPLSLGPGHSTKYRNRVFFPEIIRYRQSEEHPFTKTGLFLVTETSPLTNNEYIIFTEPKGQCPSPVPHYLIPSCYDWKYVIVYATGTYV